MVNREGENVLCAEGEYVQTAEVVMSMKLGIAKAVIGSADQAQES